MACAAKSATVTGLSSPLVSVSPATSRSCAPAVTAAAASTAATAASISFCVTLLTAADPATRSADPHPAADLLTLTFGFRT